jgi:hypothetical protein
MDAAGLMLALTLMKAQNPFAIPPSRRACLVACAQAIERCTETETRRACRHLALALCRYLGGPVACWRGM